MRSPDEIRDHRFLVSLRGYDRDEVHTFLAGIADEMAALHERVTELNEQLERSIPLAPTEGDDPEASPFAEVGTQTQRILEAAEEAAEKMRTEAKTEAAQERREVRTETTRQIAEAERRVEELTEQVAQLEAIRDEVGTQLRNAGRLAVQAVRNYLPDEPVVSEAPPVQAPPPEAVPQPSDAGNDLETPEPSTPEAPEPQPETYAPPPSNTAEEAPAAAEPEEAAPPAAAGPVVPLEWPPGATAEIDPFETRAATLRSLHPRLIRSVKRSLREVAAQVWDQSGDWSGSGPPNTVLDPLTETVRPVIARAHEAGAASGARLVGVEPPDGVGEPQGVAEELARRVVDQVCTLAGDRRDAGQRAFESAVEEMGEVSLPEITAFDLLVGYERGLLDAWAALGVTHRRWVRPTGAQCLVDACAQNVAAPATPVGTAFPSGDHTPPVDVGCICTTVPDRATA